MANCFRLDFETHKSLIDYIFQRVGASSTVIMVTHHVQDLTMFDRVLLVTEGEVAETPVRQGVDISLGGYITTS